MQELGAKGPSDQRVQLQTCTGKPIGLQDIEEHTAIELTGVDRPGLLSEISAVLATLRCNVSAAAVWTHNLRVACVVYVTDETTKGPISDSAKLVRVKELLAGVMRPDDGKTTTATEFSVSSTRTERRLHQMLFADRDYEVKDPYARLRRREAMALKEGAREGPPGIGIRNCVDTGYSIIVIRTPDRPKLLFDTVCTLTDMQYVVFHASIDSTDGMAFQVRMCLGCCHCAAMTPVVDGVWKFVHWSARVRALRLPGCFSAVSAIFLVFVFAQVAGMLVDILTLFAWLLHKYSCCFCLSYELVLVLC